MSTETIAADVADGPIDGGETECPQKDQQTTDSVQISAVPAIEWVMLYGVPVLTATSLEDEKISPATCGRTKIPLQRLVQYGSDLACGNSDIYISVALIRTKEDGHTVVASDLLLTGSTEVDIYIGDPSPINGMRFETIVGSCLLILNPKVSGPRKLYIPSLKNCMRIGRISDLSVCEHCDKPVFVPRDGTCCYAHASRKAGLRLGVVGGQHGGNEPVQEKKREQTTTAVDPAIKAARLEQGKREAFLARKKTAILLANRRSECGSNQIQLNTTSFGAMRDSLGYGKGDGGELMMELGSRDIVDTKSRLERFAALKRKRGLIEKRDREKILQQENQHKQFEPPKSPAKPDNELRRKSLLLEMDDLIKTERGFI
jgi:hypothetical protein